MKKILLFALLTASSAWSQVNVTAAGLQVAGEPYKAEGSRDELRAFNGFARTKVALLLKSTGMSIVELNEKESKVTVFGDDQGSDFLKAKARFSSKSYSFDMMPDVSDDGKAMMTSIETPGMTAKGAKLVLLKGELKVTVASKSEKKKSAKVALEKGAELTVHGITFTIDKVGKPDFGDDALEITLKATGNFKDFKDSKNFEFFDASGEKLKSDRGSWSSGGMVEKRSLSVTYSFEKKVTEISMGVDIWTDLKEIAVPFDLKVGPGL